MGHNMGMLHDFHPSHGGQNGPCNGKGIMSYGSSPNVWSTCSKNDFQALYNDVDSWCLDGMEMYLECLYTNKIAFGITVVRGDIDPQISAKKEGFL